MTSPQLTGRTTIREKRLRRGWDQRENSSLCLHLITFFPPEPSAWQQEQLMAYTHEEINHSLSVTNKKRSCTKMPGVYMKWRNSVFLKSKFLVTCSVNSSGWYLPAGVLYQLIFSKHYKIAAHRGIPANYI